MDNIFRIKKSRDTAAKSKASETISGTLDSIHQSLITEMKDINIDNPTEWMQNQDFNFMHVTTLPRDKKTLVDFLTTNATFVQGKWYYSQ